MKWIGISLLLLFLFQGCKKDNRITVVALEVSLSRVYAPIEWNQIEGSFSNATGLLLIDAEAVSGEIFKLHLHPVLDTGLIQNLSIQQMFFSDGEFQPSKLKDGSVLIEKITTKNINGIFRASLLNDEEEREINGRFVMHLAVKS